MLGEGKISYIEAAQRVFRRREAFAAGQPCSVVVLGFGSTFIYHEGTLCYRSGNSLRILNVHDSAQAERVIHLPTLLYDEIGEHARDQRGTVTLLCYGGGILVCLYVINRPVKEAYLIAIRVKTSFYGPAKCLIAYCLKNMERVFARTNCEYLCCGTHTQSSRYGWTISCFSLTTGEPIKTDIHLPNFAGSKVGTTVCFEIHRAYFYAVTTESCFDAEVRDWISYYHCYRIPLNDSTSQKSLEQNRIRRRDQIEGPINNLWNDLRLHVDECSGDLVIVETRREWQGGASSSQRTSYMQPMDIANGEVWVSSQVSPGSPFDTPPVEAQPVNHIHAVPNNSYTTLNWRPITKERQMFYRPPRYHHASNDAVDSVPHFNLSRTKLQYYEPSSSTFLNLVCDVREDRGHDECRPQPRLRLQVGSRKLGPPQRDLDGLLVQPEIDERTGSEREGSEELWIGQGPWLWPPPDRGSSPTPTSRLMAKVEQIMNYHSLCRRAAADDDIKMDDIVAAADERSVVYSTGPATSATQAIILINFDPAIRFPGLHNSSSSSSSSSSPAPLQTLSSFSPPRTTPPLLVYNPNEQNRIRIRTRISQVESESQEHGPPDDSTRWISTERASYLDIGMGVSLS